MVNLLNKINVKGKGYALVTLIIILNLIIWLASKYFANEYFENPFKYLAKVSSLTGTLLMSFTLILSAKYRFSEFIFNGLDKVYKAHSSFGRYSFLLLLLHPIFLALTKLPDFNKTLTYFIPNFDTLYNIGHAVGLFILFGMLVLLYITISMKISYELWKKSHLLFGPLFAFAIVHIVLVNADLSKYFIFQLWYFGWLLFGLFSYINILLKPYLGKKYDYKVTNVSKHLNVVELELKPFKDSLNYKPGQFVYCDFNIAGYVNEWHPYSIAGYKNDGTVKLGIKGLGDYSNKIQEIEVGTMVKLQGPYGYLSDTVLSHPNKKVVLIGAGIGITPMISIWEYLNKYNKYGNHLFYINSYLEDCTFDNDIKNIKVSNLDNKYEIYLDNRKNFFDIKILKQKLLILDNTIFVICGPERMMNGLLEGLINEGVSYQNIIIENFNFGIGSKLWF